MNGKLRSSWQLVFFKRTETFAIYVHFDETVWMIFMTKCLKEFELHFDWITMPPEKRTQFLPYTVSNKNTHLADFETCAFRGYFWNHLSYKKVLFASLSKELSDKIKNFWNPVTKSANIFKNAVLPDKSKLLEKIRHFE